MPASPTLVSSQTHADRTSDSSATSGHSHQPTDAPVLDHASSSLLPQTAPGNPSTLSTPPLPPMLAIISPTPRSATFPQSSYGPFTRTSFVLALADRALISQQRTCKHYLGDGR
ncbi:hypothetical protein FISHEDRAFT_74981 [Fistulina hepatica ATCC 64428]|uniref:Uncharacterized protein n=1 Tax=Fistulina hepatica ATCC 64428 TaxID=1128425 RepID=A0A0D7A8Q6_9AGAR|nr:hypothetical protein FISHEDRAFT_74981 [Fistulina hepatica ATCC 64428]